ncbi:MAG: helix-turn-helix domain-containing protein [Pikeienuella sp.]|uniref:helix-turn-helix domain-containing protein n=1 Tax=Pikeienuella sp. TaxID=2831957 RepID=UPI00391C5A55
MRVGPIEGVDKKNPMNCPACDEYRQRAEKAEEALRALIELKSLDPRQVGAALGLSPQQARIVTKLASNPGVVTSEALIGDTSRGRNLLRVVIHNIRADAPWAEIKAIKGVGYSITADTRAEVFRRVKEFLLD